MKFLRLTLLGLVSAMLLSSCGKQADLPQINGVQGPFFNVQNGKILISMVLETLQVNVGGTIPLGNALPSSTLEVTPAQQGGTFFQVALDYEDLENGRFEFINPETLPGGRPIPGIIGGALPALAVEVPELNDSIFYVNQNLFGFFLQLKRLNSPIGLTHRLHIDGSHIGNISLIGADENGENSGLLLLLNLDSAAKKKLKRLINMSKRKKNRKRKF